MLLLTGQADECRRAAKRCRRDAGRLKDPMFRNQMLRVAAHWADLAQRFELAEQVSGFLQWDAQRMKGLGVFHDQGR